MISTE
ncbi:hypothetical protein QN277_016699 [Acacia crassicarpa]